ncbi:MAG: ABC transporter ATP-binding protein [Trueperaceae bacterium]|nr:ABC transporter ATP-binding protein [Trueperaceae bacterium]
MANVTFASITKQFGTVKAVDDVSFELADGEFVCLLGPSGCGKTTTLRMIAGLEQPTSGRISIGGEDVTDAKPKERDIGMVFQDYALFPHMTIEANIAYPLKVRGVGARERAARAAEVAASLQIDQLLARRPGQISGGQQQRTSLARAVVHKPRVYLFDEPLSNLDAKLRLEARSFLKHLQRELGVTSIYVTHDQAEAMALADRVAVMDKGRIVQIGPPLEVYHRPATTFVANFLGSPPMNLLPVRLEGGAFHAGPLRVDARGFADRLRGVAEGSELTLGLRPEHLRLGGEGDEWTVPGHVYAVEPLGPESLVTLRVGEGLVTARLFGDEAPQVTGDARFAFDPKNLHLFGADGRRIQVP